MNTVLIVFGVIVLCGLVYCSTQESKVFSPYKEHRVFGRIKAYLALDFVTAGFYLWLASSFAGLFTSLAPANMGLIGVLSGAILFGVGLFFYASAYAKCPVELRSKCIVSMIIVGLGVTVKICLFFLPFIWKVATYSGPTYSAPTQEKKKVTRVWKEDFHGNRTYYKVGPSGEYYQDEDGNWKRIKGA